MLSTWKCFLSSNSTYILHFYGLFIYIIITTYILLSLLLHPFVNSNPIQSNQTSPNNKQQTTNTETLHLKKPNNLHRTPSYTPNTKTTYRPRLPSPSLRKVGIVYELLVFSDI